MTKIGYITSMISWLGFFSAIFLSYFFFLKFRTQERKLLIEKNLDISEIFKTKENRIPWHVIGFTIFGSALGVLIGVFLFDYIFNISSDNLSLIITSTAFLFGAVGIIIGKMVEDKRN